MDGLQVASASREKQAVIIRQGQADKYTSSQPYAYPGAASDQLGGSDYHPSSPTPYNQPLACTPSHLPCGLSVLAYTILVAAVTLAICAAGFGGGIGAIAASKDKNCSTNNNDSPIGAESQATITITTTTRITTTTTSSTATSSPVNGLVNDYAPLSPSSVNTTSLNCTTGTSVYSASGSQFQLTCDKNYPGNDIVSLITYTLDTCVEACANMNVLQAQTVCHGVMYNANLAMMVQGGNGNCWLKTAMQNPVDDDFPPSVGAALISSP
ncbi:uncharacterized protein Z519_09030 [Cladophialophora bantiana CBS 173.52]|uniref:Apple domain-containing protein n=1 Tax=Cladophialophora bantiana (strain ATCC 10958 / CBS 173.52 / CDC B-1940 / NIH 8579) TaxID=1442370 RepID=A0A0D2HHW7_CLAB1|nr:uncharacterized protein Z519_09030 [Cladophialophora bantiana CBS 173.52]KIW90385.1 hypothetical protein Z519_09030 [Cladophialophora bantiana CBS 173.52]